MFTRRKGIGGSFKVRLILATSMILLFGIYKLTQLFITDDPLITGSILAGVAAINIISLFYIYSH